MLHALCTSLAPTAACACPFCKLTTAPDPAPTLPFPHPSIFSFLPHRYPSSTGRSFQEILRAVDSLQLAERLPVATQAEWRPGEEVMIKPSVSEEEAKKLFPDHHVIQVKSGKAYIRKTKVPEE